jgi:hypothetical protein
MIERARADSHISMITRSEDHLDAILTAAKAVG